MTRAARWPRAGAWTRPRRSVRGRFIWRRVGVAVIAILPLLGSSGCDTFSCDGAPPEIRSLTVTPNPVGCLLGESVPVTVGWVYDEPTGKGLFTAGLQFGGTPPPFQAANAAGVVDVGSYVIPHEEVELGTGSTVQNVPCQSSVVITLTVYTDGGAAQSTITLLMHVRRFFVGGGRARLEHDGSQPATAPHPAARTMRAPCPGP